MPPKTFECPKVSVYAHGYSKRVEVWANTEADAMQALQALLPQAKDDALAAQSAALQAGIAAGDAICRPGKAPCKNKKCEAWFKAPDLGPPWTAVGALEPFVRWLARGGYEWTVLVDCRCPEPSRACAITFAAADLPVATELDSFRQFRDNWLATNERGRSYLRLLEDHTQQVLTILANNPELRKRAAKILESTIQYIRNDEMVKGQPVKAAFINDVDNALQEMLTAADPRLHKLIGKLRFDLKQFVGVSVAAGLSKLRP